MSVKISSRVWESSAQQGSALIVLLAIADFADDQGYAWPSIPTLAQKARLKDRQVQDILRSLVESAELRVLLRAGPVVTTRGGMQRPNLYQVLVGGALDRTTLQGGAVSDPQVVQSGVQGGALASAPKPSLQVLEPSKKPSKQLRRSISVAELAQNSERADQQGTISRLVDRARIRFRWRLTKTGLLAEHRYAGELLELYPEKVIAAAIDRRQKLSSLRWIAEWMSANQAEATPPPRAAIQDLPPATPEQIAEHQRKSGEMIAQLAARKAM